VAGNGPFTLSATSAGTCVVTATKAADGTYAATSSVATTVTFATSAQATLVVTSTAGTVGTDLPLTTSGGSGTGAVTYAVTDGTASDCTVAGNGPFTLSATSAGTCVVTATKAADGTYAATSSVATTVTFAQTPGTVSITSMPPAPPSIGGTYAVKTSTNAGAVTLSIDPSSGSNCSISGSMVTFVHAGSCQVDAVAAATIGVSEASTHQTVTIAQTSQLINFAGPASGIYGATVTLSATGGGSGIPVVFSVDLTSTHGACSVSGTDGTILTYTGVGTCVVDAQQAGNADNSPASEVQRSILVAKAGTTLIVAPVSVVGSLLSGEITLSATLISQVTGKGIAGVVLTIADGPLVTCTATTNANGVATCTVSVLGVLALVLSPSYSATYSGGTDYLASNAKGKVNLL
jgi:hypothetical protein